MEKNEMLKQWLKLKAAEDKAKKARYEIEKEIETLYGTDFSGESKTFTEDDLGFKVNLKKNTSYKLDQEAYLAIRGDIPDEQRPEKISFVLDVPGFTWLKSNAPDVYKRVSECVTISENKTIIKVEKIK